MAAYRLNSVYDLTSLRLHPDGTRVLRPALGTAIRDTRGNLIASDAGGTGTAPRYRRVREDTGGESIDLDDAGSRPGTANTKRRRKVPKPRRGAVDAEDDTMGEAHQPGGRAQKRMKFDDDISFLEPGLSLAQYADFAGPPTLPSQEADASWFPLPSSDLLKFIHYFAAQYYSQRGQLFNASLEDRRERKERRKLLETHEQGMQANAASPSTPGPAGASTTGGKKGTKPKKRNQKHQAGQTNQKQEKRTYRRDMYRTMDGSALVAIGMVMQEYVARMLDPIIPEGWEESMREYMEEDDDEDDDLDYTLMNEEGDEEEDEETEEEDESREGEDARSESDGEREI